MPLPSGWPELPCPKCGARTAGLQFGEWCPTCQGERRVRVRRLSSRVSLVGTLLMALYVWLRMPPQPSARLYGVIAVAVTYLILRRIVSRVAAELLPK